MVPYQLELVNKIHLMNYQQNSEVVMPKESLKKSIRKTHKYQRKPQKHVHFALKTPMKSQKKYIHYSSEFRRTPRMSGWDIKKPGMLRFRDATSTSDQLVKPTHTTIIPDDLVLTPPPVPISESDCVLLIEYFDLAKKMDYLKSMKVLLEAQTEEITAVIRNKTIEKDETEKNIFTIWSELSEIRKRQLIITSKLKN